jgi:hypothetical protein
MAFLRTNYKKQQQLVYFDQSIVNYSVSGVTNTQGILQFSHKYVRLLNGDAVIFDVIPIGNDVGQATEFGWQIPYSVSGDVVNISCFYSGDASYGSLAATLTAEYRIWILVGSI